MAHHGKKYRAGATMIGMVLNKTSGRDQDGYYYYPHEYSSHEYSSHEEAASSAGTPSSPDRLEGRRFLPRPLSGSK